MKQIPLTQGKFAIVDDEDFEDLNRRKWCYCTGYAGNRSERRNGGAIILMHRHIMGLKEKDGKIVDHINQNKLDNRRCNLRITTRSINNRNCKPTKNKSGYRGVYQDMLRVNPNSATKCWRSEICIFYKTKMIGYFYTALEAAKARDKYIIDNNLEGFPLNFPIN